MVKVLGRVWARGSSGPFSIAVGDDNVAADFEVAAAFRRSGTCEESVFRKTPPWWHKSTLRGARELRVCVYS